MFSGKQTQHSNYIDNTSVIQCLPMAHFSKVNE